MASTPVELGYRWPAEWETQECAYLGWPDLANWFRDDAKHAQQAVVNFATAISAFQLVVVLANPSQVAKARQMCPEAVQVQEMPLETPYVRDTAPLFVVRETPSGTEAAGIDFQFNVYGAKKGPDGKWYQKYGAFYADELQDALLAQRLLASADIPRFESSMVLEGGSVHADGQGTLVTTAECLLNPNRNPDLTREEIEAELGRQLGIEKVLWLPLGLYADHHTNGHVDNFCCFVRPGKVLLAWTDDEDDPQYGISRQALQVLTSNKDARGRNIEVVKVPTPPPMYITKEEEAGMKGEPKKRRAGDRIPASYINFYLANGGAVIPSFGLPNDKLALDIIQEAFGPETKVVAVPAREIVLGGGDFHCMTMQRAAAQSKTTPHLNGRS